MTGKPKRVLHVIVTLPVGGAENLLLSIVRGLDRDCFLPLVCCISDKGVLGREIERLGVPLIALELMHDKGYDSRIVHALVNLIRQHDVALVHSHLYHANLYGRLAAKRCGIPAVASVQNTYARTKWHRQLLNWYLGRHTAAIIAGSEDIKRDIVRYDHVAESRVTVIPNAIDLDRCAPRKPRQQIQAELHLAVGEVVLGTLGRLEEQKGHRYLIDALAKLKQRRITPKLLLIGDGRERRALEAQVAKLGLDDQVLFLGTRNDIGDLFSVMDLFVMPSLWEGLSLAMLSAMAASVPVIATSVGGVPAVLGDDEYGIQVEPGNADALAAHIESALAKSERMTAIAAKAADYVRARYSDEGMVARVQEIYTAALGGC